MLKSISCWALKDNEVRPAESLFEEVQACGFAAIELTVGEKGLLTPQSSRDDCDKLLDAAGAAGIQVSSIASGLGWQYPLSADAPEAREKARQIFSKCLGIGGWLGVDCMLLVPGQVSQDPEHVPYDICYERMQEEIKKLIPAAEEAGVTIGVENVWNKVLLSPLEMRDFVDSFDSQWVRCYLDVGNMIISGHAEDWVRILGSRIASVHLKDFKRSVGTIDGFCDLLEGDVNYPAVMAALRQTGYDGPCVAEFFQLEQEALKKVSAAVDRILAM